MTSDFVIRPSLPEPMMIVASRSCSSSKRRTAGLIFAAADWASAGSGASEARARPLSGRTYLTSGGGLPWSLPPGTRVDWLAEGELEITRDVFRDLGVAFGVALLGIYGILIYQTGSYAMPLILNLDVDVFARGEYLRREEATFERKEAGARFGLRRQFPRQRLDVSLEYGIEQLQALAPSFQGHPGLESATAAGLQFRQFGLRQLTQFGIVAGNDFQRVIDLITDLTKPPVLGGDFVERPMFARHGRHLCRVGKYCRVGQLPF